jgi:hypothetical protein
MERFSESAAYPTYLANAEKGRETMRRLMAKSKNAGLSEFAEVIEALSVTSRIQLMTLYTEDQGSDGPDHRSERFAHGPRAADSSVSATFRK